MNRLALAMLAAAALASGCRSHPGNAIEVATPDCISCHEDDYRAADDPPHAGRYPETCGDCHSTSAWEPAVGFGHPEAFFPISRGAHEGILCVDCHDPARGDSTAGANTDCVGCHTGEHARDEVDSQHGGVPDYQFDADMPNFCLSCHPDGQADDHPEDRFPIASGPHDMPCGDCHDADLGPSTDGENVSCIGCHTGEHSQGRMADTHDEEGDYQWQPDVPDFCRECHPRGRHED